MSYALPDFAEYSDAEALERVEDHVRQLLCYESAWLRPKASLKSVGTMLADYTRALLPIPVDLKAATLLSRECEAHSPDLVRFLLGHDSEYPESLRAIEKDPGLLYFQGDAGLLNTTLLAVVGSRQASKEGLQVARTIAGELAHDGVTVVSGLARGVDTAALGSALKAGGKVVAVIGTSILHHYPPENFELQRHIASSGLLVSHVPIVRYALQSPRQNRFFFPERNVVMSALSRGTLIVEASDTSGSLIQARAALQQGKLLLIHERCVSDSALRWPREYLRRGAIPVRSYSDVKDVIS